MEDKIMNEDVLAEILMTLDENKLNEMVEASYWRFDTINKGNERDAYKRSVKELLISLGILNP